MKQCTDCGRSEGSKATFLRVTASDKCDECLRIYEAKASRAYYAEHKAEKIARQRAVRLAVRPARVCKPVTRPASCHPDRQLHSGGLCGTCYNADLLRRRLSGEPARSKKVAACHPGRPHKAKGLCEECYRADWARRFPERKRQSRAYVLDNADDLKIADQERRLKSEYGLSTFDYLVMLQSQSSRCAICADFMAAPNIDHDHSTGAVRELLCRRCNTGIGLLKDSPAIARSAARYLEKHARRERPN